MKSLGLHLGLLALLWALCLVLPAYHQGNFARIMVLAVYAMGYNVLFGYTGLLSLGHAMFFVAGMYGTGMASLHWGMPMIAALPLGVIAGGVLAALLGVLFLRAKGVGFMIVTLMFAQAGYLLPRTNFEVAGRFGQVIAADDSALGDENEAGIAVSYYPGQHPFKIQADVFQLWGDEDLGDGETRARVQMQHSF